MGLGRRVSPRKVFLILSLLTGIRFGLDMSLLYLVIGLRLGVLDFCRSQVSFVADTCFLVWLANLSLIKFCLLGTISGSESFTGSILFHGVKSSFGLNLSSNPLIPSQILEDCLGICALPLFALVTSLSY